MYVRPRYMFKCSRILKSVKLWSLEFSWAVPQVVALDRQMNDCKDDLSQVQRTVKEVHKTHLTWKWNYIIQYIQCGIPTAPLHRICLVRMLFLQNPSLLVVLCTAIVKRRQSFGLLHRNVDVAGSTVTQRHVCCMPTMWAKHTCEIFNFLRNLRWLRCTRLPCWSFTLVLLAAIAKTEAPFLHLHFARW